MTCLNGEVIPEFYTRDKEGIPIAWVARMRESMARLTPQFSANRTVREYTEQHYIPAAAAYRRRVADKGAMGVQLVDWQRALEQHWSNLRFGELKVATDGRNHVFEVQVYLDGLEPDAVRVELYADGINGGDPVRQEMMPKQEPGDASGYILQRTGSNDPPGDGLYGARDTALRRRCDPAGRRSNPVATMMNFEWRIANRQALQENNSRLSQSRA